MIKMKELIKEYSFQIINSQQNLKKFIFERNKNFLNHLLFSLKNSNCLNTLETIIFYKINFKNIIFLKEVFEQLNVLESIHILDCSFIYDLIQRIIHIYKPFKLKSLFMTECHDNDIKLTIDLMPLLFQKSGKYLENIKFGWSIDEELKEKLLELIKNYCKKIKYFDLNVYNVRSAFLTLGSIKNLKQNLNCLSIHIGKRDDAVIHSIILTNLGQILPNKLERLHLELGRDDDLEAFLKIPKILLLLHY
jgi:hypothetical protein